MQYWDASGLAKRYAPEVGSDTADALWNTALSHEKVTSAVTYAEVYSLLLRKFNRGAIDKDAFDAAKSLLRTEIVNAPEFILLSVEDGAFYQSVTLMDKHNLNSTDAALLIMYLPHAQSRAQSGDIFLLIAADNRPVRAARSEGINAVDPEQLAASDVPDYLLAL